MQFACQTIIEQNVRMKIEQMLIFCLVHLTNICRFSIRYVYLNISKWFIIHNNNHVTQISQKKHAAKTVLLLFRHKFYYDSEHLMIPDQILYLFLFRQSTNVKLRALFGIHTKIQFTLGTSVYPWSLFHVHCCCLEFLNVVLHNTLSAFIFLPVCLLQTATCY